MLVSLPTDKGDVAVNPRHVTHVTNTTARDFNPDRCLVHVNSGVADVVFVVLDTTANVRDALNAVST